MLQCLKSSKASLGLSIVLGVVSLFLGLNYILSDFLKEIVFRTASPPKIFVNREVMHPADHQRVFSFKDLEFSSAIESGNLADVRFIEQDHYSLMIGSDPFTENEGKEFRNWFYFKVKAVKALAKTRLSIHNMQYNWSMWKHGLTHVFRSSIKTKGEWMLYTEKPVKLYLKSKKLTLNFAYNFEEGEEVEFALTFPYTVDRYENYIHKYAEEIKTHPFINFQRENLVRSNLNNTVEALFMTYKTKYTNSTFPIFQDTFPDRTGPIPYRKAKCGVVVASRVHPAETAGSFMLEGFLDYFKRNNTSTEHFFKRCNLIVVPILNPDGVRKGLTRTDNNGINLNRVYKTADASTPSIYALKKVIGRVNKKSKEFFFFDLHSHFTKRGLFMFGNPLNDKTYKKTLLFPFIFAKKEKELRLEVSKFGSKKSEHTSRKQVYRVTKSSNVFTIESNYWGNAESAFKLKDKKLVHTNLRVVKDFASFYKMDDFRRFGSNLASSLAAYFMSFPTEEKELDNKLSNRIDKYYKRYKRRKVKKRKTKKVTKLLNKQKANPSDQFLY